MFAKLAIHRYSKNKVAAEAATFVMSQLRKNLRQQSLLFISGGSVARDVCPALIPHLSLLTADERANLRVLLLDERFGPPFHEQSNMLLLRTLGWWNFLDAQQISYSVPLMNPLTSLQDTVDAYNQTVQDAYINAKFTVAILGMGTDGHIAGIKPRESEKLFNLQFLTQKLVVGYKAVDFTRITLTLTALNKLSAVVVYACGEEKRAVLQKLQSSEVFAPHKFPAALLRIHSSVELFTDQKPTTFHTPSPNRRGKG